MYSSSINGRTRFFSRRVDWDKLSVEDKAAYVNNTDTILSSVRVPIDAICCKDVNYENQSHRDELGIFYKELVGAMSAASDQLKHKRSSFSAQPGWNDYVYDSHRCEPSRNRAGNPAF